MRPILITLVILLSTVAPPARAEGEKLAGPPIEFHGNVLFNDFVYRSILELPADTGVSLDSARKVARRLARFLHDAGYQLATVRAKVEGDHLRVDISEGVLDKVLFLGEGVVETLRLKFELNLPLDVFNKPLLEQQLRRIAHRFQLKDFAYELVPVEGRGEQPLAIEELVALPFLKVGRPYELRILVQPSAWGTGFSPDLYVGGLEGLGIGGHYQGKELLVADDRWDVGARVAGAVRQHLDSTDSRPVLTRAFGRVIWYAPPLLAEGFRPAFGVTADLISYQRGDLHLDGYDQLTMALGLGASDRLLPELEIAFGLGIERRILLDVHSVGTPAPQVSDAPLAETRPLGWLQVRTTLNPQEIRTDRRHSFDIDARLYGASSPDRSMMLRLLTGYQKMFGLGWHELWINARGTLLAGDVLFTDEQSIGEHLRGPFGSSDFARRLLSVQLEFRYSLIRDLFKIGLYHDAVIFGAIDRNAVAGSDESFRAANAVGFALHHLALDEFEIDFYFGFGWKLGRADHGGALVIRQAY